jgi:hypothetical protein
LIDAAIDNINLPIDAAGVQKIHGHTKDVSAIALHRILEPFLDFGGLCIGNYLATPKILDE